MLIAAIVEQYYPEMAFILYKKQRMIPSHIMELTFACPLL
jgi:hypothetical protein